MLSKILLSQRQEELAHLQELDGGRNTVSSRPTNRSSVVPCALHPWDSPDICYKSLLFSTSLQSIGCDDYLGSDKVVDKCGVCGGDNTGCQVVSGVFKHALTSLGYHRVVEIPQGATKINITEMHKSNNYLGKLGFFPEETICCSQMLHSFQDGNTQCPEVRGHVEGVPGECQSTTCVPLK